MKANSTQQIDLGISRSNLKVSFKDRIKSLQKEAGKKEDKTGSSESTDSKQHLIPSTSTATKSKKPSTTQQLREKFKSFSQTPKDELTPWSKLKLATVVSLGGSYSSLNNSLTGDSPKLSKTTKKSSMPVDLNALKKLDAPMSSRNEFSDLIVDHKASVSDSELKSESSKVKRKPKPFKLSAQPKNYRSVDDLSPEYSGLPFVKKLKILNERQKLAELESAIQTRSFSLDCTDSSNSNEMIEVLTRSRSEASCMMVTTRPKTLNSPVVPVEPLNFTTQVPIKSPLSPESNETLERKQLKSILKRLSEDRLAQNLNVKADRPDKRLMRAQTVEGYVARRANFSKSVTFNYTLSSPPSEPSLTEEPEDSIKPLPPTSPRPKQALYPIVNAQDTSSLEKPQTLLSHRNLDQSTNRFNFPGQFDAAASPEQDPTNEYIDNPSSRSFPLVSDDNGQRRIVKGTRISFLRL